MLGQSCLDFFTLQDCMCGSEGGEVPPGGFGLCLSGAHSHRRRTVDLSAEGLL